MSGDLKHSITGDTTLGHTLQVGLVFSVFTVARNALAKFSMTVLN